MRLLGRRELSRQEKDDLAVFGTLNRQAAIELVERQRAVLGR